MEGLQINGIDIFIGVTLLTSATLAYFRGFVHEMLSIIGWVGASASVLFGLPFVKDFARKNIEPSWAADAAASSILFLVALIVISLITSSIIKKIRNSAFNLLDRTLGFVFGLARGAFFVILGYVCLTWLVPSDMHPDWIKNARSLPAIELVSNKIKDLIPEEFITGFEKKTEEIKDKAKEKADDAKDKVKDKKDDIKDSIEDKIEDKVEEKTDAGQETLKKIEETFKKLTQPETKASPDKDREGYKNSEREDLEKLIENNQ